jgi:hypothetical protein
MSLDHDEKDRLWAAGFRIDRITGVAMAVGGMTVTVVREREDCDPYVEIVLPNGMKLGCTATRGAVLGINRGLGVGVGDDRDDGW